jgi:peptidoglycan/xylan/chitin deacetylase (PgdA/CDA1 family)
VSESAIPILTYHSIDPSGSVISTRKEKFRAQMEHVRDAGFRVISLRELVRRMGRSDPLPDRPLVITFDDGFKSVYEAAYPTLREFGFPATVFLIAGRCGQINQWSDQSGIAPHLALLDWEEIAEMSDNGVEFGAHTLTHPNLSRISIEKAAAEIVGSKTLIQERLDREVSFFAYPYGRMTPQIQNLVRQHFDGACSTELRLAQTASDRHFLPRIEMYYFSRNERFHTLGRPPFHRYVAWRRALRGVRRLWAT